MANSESPMVSVCMIAFNVAPFVEAAIEGVLNQQTNFSVELVIGEDSSKDATRSLCEAYAERFPDRVRLLPSDVNRGIAGNAARTLAHCRGRYIAICDADDIWVDSLKLQTQVTFLENHPDYGVVYTDVQVIATDGAPLDDSIHDGVRSKYASGIVFFDLLNANFINNSTALFRRSLIADHKIDTDRQYFTHDYQLWVHVASRAKVHFHNVKTTQYRKHEGNVTKEEVKRAYNRRKFQEYLYQVILDFDRHYQWPVSEKERAFFFRKMLSYLLRSPGSFQKKLHVLRLLPRHIPPSSLLVKSLLFSKDKRFALKD